MEELVDINHIEAKVEAKDWKDAIRKAGALLLNSDDIEEAYIENMIRSVEELGPYMVLSKGFALAHSAPCPEVKRTSVSLVNLSEPVEFGSRNDPVTVVMCLACKDKGDHMEYLQKIARKLMEDNMINRLGSCTDTKELYATING